MASGGGGGSDGQLHLRQNLTTRRLREDLQNVVRSSLSPLMEGGAMVPPSSLANHLSSLLPTSPWTNTHPSSSVSETWSAGSSWAASSPGSSTTAWTAAAEGGGSWPDDNTVTLQPGQQQQQPSGLTASHVLDIEVFQAGQAPSFNQSPPSEEPQQQQPQQPPPPPTPPQPSEQETGWTQVLNSNPELRTVVNACERYIPICFIVFTKSVFEHGTGIVVFLGLFLTFLHANSVLKNQISRQSRRNRGALLAISINLIASIFFIYYVFSDDNLCLSAFFVPPERVSSFYDLIWIVGVNDFVLKFISVLTKTFITLLPARLLQYKMRGKYYLFIEITSQSHRQLAPLQPWLMYLLHSKGDGPASIPNKVLGVFLTAGYMVIKGSAFMKAIKQWRAAFQKLLQSTRYGKTPSPDQMKASGGFCPICQDSYQEPTILQCKHIFCEDCVSTWFDRDTTCPMCRAKVSEDPSWRDGATSQFIQLF